MNNNRVTSILEDVSESGHVLWIGTYAGLDRFDREKNIFTHYTHDPNDPTSLSHDNINQVYEDRSGILWIATRAGGLNKFDREKGVFTRYLHDVKDSTSLSNNEVNMVYESPNYPGVLWIGTYGGGLDRFDKKTETFIHYRERDGLCNMLLY